MLPIRVWDHTIRVKKLRSKSITNGSHLCSSYKESCFMFLISSTNTLKRAKLRVFWRAYIVGYWAMKRDNRKKKSWRSTSWEPKERIGPGVSSSFSPLDCTLSMWSDKFSSLIASWDTSSAPMVSTLPVFLRLK